MPLELINGIVNIRGVGTGFVVSEDGLIVTCAHVIGRNAPDKIPVLFYIPNKESNGIQVVQRTACLLKEWFSEEVDDDVAVLQVEEKKLPDGVLPLPLGSSAGIDGHAVRTFGFPVGLGEMRGIPGYGTAYGPSALLATGKQRQSTRPLIAIRSSEITRGFSGSPVWDELRRRVVGMVVIALPPDDIQRMSEAAYATPTETLRSVCPRLMLSDECPYRYLEVFTDKDAQYFFGRQRAADEMIANLRNKDRNLAVFGPSGSGKSSVVRAGLIPQLQNGALPNSDRWHFLVFRPADDPFTQLANAGLVIPSRNLADGVKAWEEHNPQQPRLVLVIDQFEELFVTCTEPICQNFVTQLAALIDGTLPVTVILTMRNDFYSHLAQYDTLMKLLDVVNVPASLTEQELKDIIREPAKIVGLQLEDNLVETIVKDAIATNSPSLAKEHSASSTVLPLLEFALSQLWERRENGMLTYKAYQNMGGVTGSLRDWGDKAYGAFTDIEQQHLVRRIFTDLVRPGDENQDIPNVRRRRSMIELWRDDGEKEHVQSIVRQLVAAHLLVTGGDAGKNDAGSKETVEIIHDALLREWNLLSGWLSENRSFMEWRADLNNRLQNWLKNRATDDLLQGHFLSSSVSMLEAHRGDLNPAEQAFILASKKRVEEETADLQKRLEESQRQRALIEQRRIEAEQEREEARRQQRIAEQEREEARRQQRIAEQQKQLALARQLMAQAALLRTQQGNLLQRSVLLAVEAALRSSSPETNQTLREGLELLPRPVVRLQPDGEVTAAALSSQGWYLLIANKDAPVSLWEMVSKSVVVRLNHEAVVTMVKFSLDEHSIVTVGNDNSARIWETASGRLLARLFHDGEIKEVALSPAGRSVAIISREGKASIYEWDQQGARKIDRLTSADIITATTFSHDGRYFATANIDCVVRVWEIPTGRLLANLTHNNSINAIAFSPDGRFLSTVGDDRNARLWFWRASSDVRPMLFTHEAPVNAVAFSPDGKYFATASKDQTARVWEIASGRRLNRLNHEDNVNAVTFSPDGQYLATTSDDRTVGIWETSSGYRLICLPHKDVGYKEKDYVHTVAFTKDGRSFATVSNNGQAALWKIVNTRLRHSKCVNMVAFSPDSKYLASASDDSTAVVWETANGRRFIQVSHEGNAWAVAFSPDGRLLATASKDGSARLVDLTGSRQPLRLAHSANVNSVAFSPDGKFIATASEDKTAAIWDTIAGNQLFSLTHEDSVYAVIFSPRGDFLVTTCGNGTACIWNARTRQQVFSVAHKPIINNIAISPDGKYLATAGWNSSAKLWNMVNGQELYNLPHTKKVWCVAFSPDSKYLATASDDPVPLIWDVNTGQIYRRLPPHDGSVSAITFGPTSTYLATASADRTARVWGTTTGMPLAYLRHEDSIATVTFSPDGQYLATASGDGTARIWTWQTKALVAEACTRLTRNLTEDEWRQYMDGEPYHKTCSNW